MTDATNLLSQVEADRLAELYRLREAWLARGERDLAAAKMLVEAPGCPKLDAVIKHLQSMLRAIAEADCLTSEDRAGLQERVGVLARIAYQRVFEDVVDRAHAIVRGEAKGRIEPLLEAAETYIDALGRLALDRGLFEGLRVKLAILRETNERGDSAAAKKRDQLKPRPFNEDQRLFVRYRDPVLLVQFAGARYRVFDWSLGGLSILRFSGRPGAPGAAVEIKFCVEGGRVYQDKASYCRHEPGDGKLALQLRRFGSSMVTLKQECDARGIALRS